MTAKSQKLDNEGLADEPGQPELMPTSGAYTTIINYKKCGCGASLRHSTLRNYDHEGGWPLRAHNGPQWLYVECWKCRDQISLDRLEIPRDPQKVLYMTMEILINDLRDQAPGVLLEVLNDMLDIQELDLSGHIRDYDIDYFKLGWA